ncbi:MAG TPA: arylsulfotransferase family protein [Solirubrobacteraceae bacterium]|nr:arylsulfotransferase family protein [Solirubrobacteraceae bacterium]
MLARRLALAAGAAGMLTAGGVALSSAAAAHPRGPSASSAAPGSGPGLGPTQRFHSEPGLRPPVLSLSAGRRGGSADIFLTPMHSPQRGPMIVNSRGQLVWFLPRRHGVATNLEVQSYRGQPVLTWWEAGPGRGRDVIMNRSYRVVKVLHAGHGYTADSHEFQLTAHGTAYLNAVAPVRTDLTGVGGPRQGMADDDIIQELDVRTGRVLWEWHSLSHVPVTDSYYRQSFQQPYDYFHLNSIQQLPGGNLLISARNTWAVYEIDHRTGRIMWTLGGRHSDFAIRTGAEFEWQHDARLSGHLLSLFDDAALPQEEPQSSGKLLRLNLRSRTVRLVRRYTHSPPLVSGQEGNMQLLPGGDVFVGWGAQPDFSQYAPGGRQILNGSFAEGVMSYRAYRFAWMGQPLTRPAMAAARSTKGVRVWASWNGATDVSSWRVLGGSSPTQLKRLKTTPAAGFETTIALVARPRYLAVQALSSGGSVLSTSRVMAGPA